MRPSYLFLGLLVLLAVASIVASFNPETSTRLAEAREAARFTGETREMVIVALALGIGGFIAYLALSRR